MLKLNTLYNLDCMIGMRDFPDKYFDLCICDPPYGIGDFQTTGDANKYKKHKEKKYQDVKKWNMAIPTPEYFNELKRVSVNQIIWGANYYNCFSSGGGCIVWDKNNESSQRYSNCEIASCTLQKKISIFRYTWNGFIQEANKDKEDRIHSCQKPVALYKWLLQNYAKPGDKILDTHAGSCSSVIACIDGGFDWIAFELDEDYYKAALQRINNHVRQFDIFNENKSNNIQATIF